MLSIENINLIFGKGTINEKKVFSDFSLTVNDGDFITIIGSNGAGKSTLFNVISGIYMINSGKIILDGKDITYMPDFKRSRVIGRLFQDPMKGTAPNMTIAENLFLSYENSGPFKMMKKSTVEMFKEEVRKLNMGLEDMMDMEVGLLSGGQRQALSLLMATMKTPKILLLDEHTAALDPKTADKVLSITDDIVKSKHITCLMVTHNMKQAITYGNRLLMMNAGNVVYDIKGEEKQNSTIDSLLEKFKTNEMEEDDKLILS